VFAALALLIALPAAAADIAGTPPGYADKALTEPANAAAILRRAWVPGLDDSFVPQGLAVAGDHVYLGGYFSDGRQPACRVYRIARATLAVSGHHDIANYCGHAGGLAHAGGDRLFVSDTGRLYELSLARAFVGSDQGLVKTWSLRFPLKGSFLAFADGALWLGVYKKPGNGTLFVVPLEKLGEATGPGGLGPDHVAREVQIPPRIQGAAFDAQGWLWLSQSNSQEGSLQRFDPAAGKVVAEYPAMAGIEDIGFDADGRLWASSEAGAKRWLTWSTFYPLLFAIDVSALR
jgi:hypothetical protein